jgi:AraC-like DNA-binding protein
MGGRRTDLTTVFRFSTDHIPVDERNGAIGLLYEEGALPSKIETLPSRSPNVTIVRRAIGEFGILSGCLAGVRQEGLRGDGKGRDDDLFLAINVGGTCFASHRRQEVILNAGEAVLMTREDTGWSITRPDRSDFVGLKMPRAAVAAMAPNIDDAMIKRLPTQLLGLKLLKRYLQFIADDDAFSTVELGRMVANQVFDLTAFSVNELMSERTDNDGDIRIGRLTAIKSEILARLHDTNLNVTSMARQHKISVRYLQKLFELEGMTFSEYILSQRLARAHKILSSPMGARYRIASIAYRVGFNDVSYFNRAFRRQYGASPRELRALCTPSYP